MVSEVLFGCKSWHKHILIVSLIKTCCLVEKCRHWCKIIPFLSKTVPYECIWSKQINLHLCIYLVTMVRSPWQPKGLPVVQLVNNTHSSGLEQFIGVRSLLVIYMTGRFVGVVFCRFRWGYWAAGSHVLFVSICTKKHVIRLRSQLLLHFCNFRWRKHVFEHDRNAF